MTSRKIYLEYLPLAEKLKELRHEKGVTQQQAAEQMGLPSQSSYENFESASRKATLSMLELFAEYYDVSVDYLAGRTNIRKPKFLSTISEKADSIMQKIPHYSKPISAGSGQWLEEGHEFELADFKGVPDGTDFALTVRGDSMEPMYYDNDIVFVKMNVIIESGQVGVFYLNGEGYLKMLQGNKLVSLNSEYEPIIIQEYDEFVCIGRVVGKTRG